MVGVSSEHMMHGEVNQVNRNFEEGVNIIDDLLHNFLLNDDGYNLLG